MIVGVGVDVLQLNRLDQLVLARLARRVLTPLELKIFEQKKQKKAWLGKRFAMKEALSKALKTGIGAQFSFQDVSIVNHDSGAPEVVLNDKAQQLFNQKGIKKTHLSVSDEAHYVVAMVILSGDDQLGIET